MGGAYNRVVDVTQQLCVARVSEPALDGTQRPVTDCSRLLTDHCSAMITI
jgi:hypothetical protein